ELSIPEGDYTMISNGGEPFAGMMANSSAEQPTQWMPYIKVDDVDAVTAKAIELGAKSVIEPTDIPKGRFSVVVDPAGAAIGLMS
ncbi:MAG: VOC family protein, partial [Candidatus Marinimicrobia bacterium]|nr:VOC family protein [Candidatus Neomarinimicrobiota bacterium]